MDGNKKTEVNGPPVKDPDDNPWSFVDRLHFTALTSTETGK